MARRHSVNTEDEVLEEEDEDFTLDMRDTEDEELEDDDDEEDEEEDDSDEQRGGTERSSQQEIDWEARFKGLQTTLNRKDVETQQLMQQVLMARAEAFRATLAAQDLEPQEAERQFQLWAANQALQLQAAKNQSDQQSIEEVSRAVFLQQLVTDFNLDPKSTAFQKISRMKDPEDMRAMASEISTTKKNATKATRKAVRKVTKADKFDNGGSRGTPAPKKVAKSLDEAALMFAKYKIEI